MNRLVAAAMLITVGALVGEVIRGDVSTWAAWISLALTVFAVGLAAGRTVRYAVRLGTQADSREQQAELARTILHDHVACFTAIVVVRVVQLAGLMDALTEVMSIEPAILVKLSGTSSTLRPDDFAEPADGEPYRRDDGLIVIKPNTQAALVLRNGFTIREWAERDGKGSVELRMEVWNEGATVTDSWLFTRQR